MARVENLDQIKSKRKAIIAVFPFAAWRERGGDHRMVDAFSGVFRVPDVVRFMARPIATLLKEECPDYPDWIVTLVSPHIDWGTSGLNGNAVAWWAAAALAVPYTEEVCQRVVDALLQISSVGDLNPHISVDLWAWLKRQSSLPPVCSRRSAGTTYEAVRKVRELGNVEILKSYLLLVWSEWVFIPPSGFTEMRTSIREDLAGIGMGRHREILVEGLDRVIAGIWMERHWEVLAERLSFDIQPFDREAGRYSRDNMFAGAFRVLEASRQWGELKEVLLKVDRRALKVLTSTPLGLVNSFNLLTPVGFHRIPLDVHLCTPSPMSVVARL